LTPVTVGYATFFFWRGTLNHVPHRRSQDFVWGDFFLKKVNDLFLVVALKRRSKTTK